MKRRLASVGRITVLTAIVASAGFSVPSPVGAQSSGVLPSNVGEIFDDTRAPLDHIVLMYFGAALDPASVPAGSAFVVTIAGKLDAVSSVVIPQGMYGGFLSVVRLNLATPIQPGQTGTVSYTPDLNPLQVGTNPVAAFDKPLELFDSRPTFGPFGFALAIADESRGHNHLTAVFTQPLKAGPLPDPRDFSVTGTTSGGSPINLKPTAVTSVDPGYGFGFLDLQLPTALAWDDTVSLSYTPGLIPLLDRAGASAPAFGPPDSGWVLVNLANTPIGTDVAVVPTFAGGTSPVDLTFGEVTQPGTTSLTVATTAPALPAGYQVSGTPVYYDIQTTAKYSGSITVCISYAGVTPTPTSLLHYDSTPGAWTDITNHPIDTANQVICGTTMSLSPFVLATAAQTPGAPTDVTAAAGDGSASVSWTAPAFDGGSPITGYMVIASGGQTATVLAPLTTATVTGLLNGTAYTFTVAATNLVGTGLASADSASVTPQLGATAPQTTIATVPPTGGTATTDPSATGPTPADPVTTSVTVPATAAGGSVTIAETTIGDAPTGYVFLGQQVVIVSTAVTDANNPLVLVFRIDPALVPAVIFRNGVLVEAPCDPAGTATPSPCIASGAGTTEVTVLTAQASTWNVGLRKYDFSGFFSPVDHQPVVNVAKAGSAIPVKFGLGGDRGLAVFVTGYPKSQLVPCDSSAPVDGIEETASPGAATLSFDPGSGHYQYVWKTDKAWVGTCRQFVMKLRDGTTWRAAFKFK